MRTAIKLLVSIAFMTVAATESHAATFLFTATLSGAAEAPPNASTATGTAFAVFDNVAHTLRIGATFSGLSAGVTAAHIHAATALPGVGTVGVATSTPTFTAFPSGVTSGTYDMTFNTLGTGTYNPAFVTANGGTFASAEAVLVSSMFAGTSYFNIHTVNFPGGEIRGFLTSVPEPAAWAMMICGFGLVGSAMRRRKDGVAAIS